MSQQINQAYTHPLREIVKREHGLADLAMQAELVAEMVQSPAWALVVSCLEAHVANLNAQLLNPSIRTLEAYAALTAEIRGLSGMREAAQTIVAFTARERESRQRQVAQEQA